MQEWKTQLRQALRTAGDLVSEGLIAPQEQGRYQELLSLYPMVLPRYYAALIDRRNPRCPIRLQALPSLDEATAHGPAKPDPLEDTQHQPAPRVTHRYPNRALLHLTPFCSMVCRYCFRKSLLGPMKKAFFAGDLEAGLQYLASQPRIEEVIFSGGDPFMASEALLESALKSLGTLAHIKRIRFHTRVPVTLPMRVDEAFCSLLKSAGKRTVVVTHFNHPRELTPLAAQGVARLKAASIELLNQSVLLSGVNDEAQTLCDLSEGLFELGVLPYYLHHPDRAQGTLHFDVPMARGVHLWNRVRERLPGYLVPRYVVDDPAHGFKQDVTSVLADPYGLRSQ